MATPASNTSVSASREQSSSASTPYQITPAPYAVEGQKVCFICLQNETETPDAVWVSACPCSLEAHEHCMLRWVAETEVSQQRSKSAFKCPVCKAPIIVDEPYDYIIAIRNRFARLYHQTSPFLLMAIVGGSSVAGSAAYGSVVGMLLVGPTTFKKWLGPFPKAFYQALKLSCVGPGILIVRILGSLGNMLVVPFSTISAMILVAHEDFPSWPPSLEWAMSLFPAVHFIYNLTYYQILGSFERRLNRALRGRPMTDEPNDPPHAEAPAANNNNQANRNGGGGGAVHEDEEEGIWDSVLNLGRAIIGLFDDDDEEEEGGERNEGQARARAGGGGVGADAEVVVELELNLPNLVGGGGGGGGGDDGNGHEEDADLADELNRLLDEAPAAAAAAAAPAPAPAPAAAQQPAAQPAPRPPRQNQAAPRQRRNRDRDQAAVQNQARRNDLYEPSTFGSILSSIVTSLLFPAFSYGVGEALRLTLPTSWITKQSSAPSSLWRGRPGGPVGLLQERWGRSLVGGCLFIVLKDAFALFIKYRRVQTKLSRKVRNVEKKSRSS